MKKALATTKSFVQKHQTAITIATTATVTTAALVALQMRNASILNEYLDSKGLLEDYYSLNEI